MRCVTRSIQMIHDQSNHLGERMIHPRLATTNITVVFCIVGSLQTADYGLCGELRDRRLPSEKALDQAPGITRDSVLQSRPVVPRSVYEQFRKDIRGLSQEEKGEFEKRSCQ